MRIGGVRRADLRNVALLLCAVLLLWAPRVRGPIDLRYDAGVYYLLGTSLAEGRGYRLLNEPGEIEAVQYPPLLPAVVATAQLALGTRDSVVVGQALRLLFFALSLACSGAAYVLARAYLGPGLSLLAAGLATLHHLTFFLSDLCFAELPFALATLLFALAVRRGSTWGAFLLGAAAALLRTQGLALLGAWVVDALARRSTGRAALRAFLSLFPLLLWGGYVAHVRAAPGYEAGRYAYQRAPYQYYNVTYAENLRLDDPFRPERGALSARTLAARSAANAARMPLRFGEAVSGSWEHWEQAGWALGRPLGVAPALSAATRLPRALLGLATLGGLVWLARRGEWLVPAYVAGSYLLIAVTPWPAQFPRYLSPLAPFLALALALAVRSLAAARLPGARVLAAGLLACALAVQGWAIAVTFALYHPVAEYVDRDGSRAAVRLFYHGAEWRSFEASLDWLRAHAEPDAVIATSCPQLAFLRTGHKAVMPPMEADPARAQALLDSVPARYLVVDRLEFVDVSRRYAAPVVAEFPPSWELVHQSEGVRVYRRRS